MAHYDFLQNRECEYFPCHQIGNSENFSCLFCYCPLYCLAENCGGNFRYTDRDIKDCSACLRPHQRENYPIICQKMEEVLELTRKK